MKLRITLLTLVIAATLSTECLGSSLFVAKSPAEIDNTSAARTTFQHDLGYLSGRIGVELQSTNGIQVKRVIDSGPSQKAGLQAGDRILAVDSKSVDGLALGDVVKMINGRVGAPVTLSVQKATGKKTKVKVVRDKLPLDAWKNAAEAWLAMVKNFPAPEAGTKTELPEETTKERILAENAVKEKRFGDAVDHYLNGIKAAKLRWPQGFFNAAMIEGALGAQVEDRAKNPPENPLPAVSGRFDAAKLRAGAAQIGWYLSAIHHYQAANLMKCYIQLLPNADDAQSAKEKTYVWEDKAEQARRAYIK